VLLAAFAVIKTCSTYPLLPVRVLRSRDRSGAYLITLSTGTALLGVSFFLTLLIQDGDRGHAAGGDPDRRSAAAGHRQRDRGRRDGLGCPRSPSAARSPAGCSGRSWSSGSG
jgi:hypothetical protein